jgi:hypothetical protein
MNDRATYLATMIGLASAAFGVVAALAWNSAITDLIHTVLPAGKGILPEFIYAVVVTLIAVLVLVQLGKMAAATGGESKI